MRRIVTALCLSLAVAGKASASDLAFAQGISQSSFKLLVEDAGAALSYKQTAPAAPLGLLGFEIAAEMTALPLHGADYWDAALSGNAPTALVVPKLRARKGLPLSIDVGMVYAMVPSSNMQLLGGEVAWALMDGGVALPALGLRATYTKLLGVEELDVQTAGIDATLSKGFAILTPYVGAGALWTEGKAKGKLLTDPVFLAANGGKPLQAETLWNGRYYGGLKITPFPLFGITAEVEYSRTWLYSLKLGLSF